MMANFTPTIILSDPDLRLVWWIDHYPDRIGELTELEGGLRDLKVPRDPSHDALRDEIVRFVDQLLGDIRTPQQREVLLRALTQTLEALGSTELKATAEQPCQLSRVIGPSGIQPSTYP
ncbi:hypothetical protein AB0O07_22120 [Streptomyces sp. NPDC093085]|uniref:hypothetical protein n=1 Tax=Streptomyces sp. NPDC093085 TaxID=3155068 RepID=UPI0034378907